MDYFFMNECIFKIIIKNNKTFIIKLLKSINIFIDDFELFEIFERGNTKTDILLFTNDTVINIELNKNKKSLLRNKIYIDCIKKLLPDYKVIQININLFKENNEVYNGIQIYNLYNTNEFIVFITNKDSLIFSTKNKDIKHIINYFKSSNIKNYKKLIINEEKLKENIDELIKEN